MVGSSSTNHGSYAGESVPTVKKPGVFVWSSAGSAHSGDRPPASVASSVGSSLGSTLGLLLSLVPASSVASSVESSSGAQARANEEHGHDE